MIPGYEFLYNIDLPPLGFFLLAIALLLHKKWLVLCCVMFLCCPLFWLAGYYLFYFY